MPRAKSFEHIPSFAINVLARLEAKKAVKEHLRAQGIRLSYVPAREIVAQTKAHLEAHPELYERALQRAWEMGVCRPVLKSDNAKMPTETIGENAQPTGE